MAKSLSRRWLRTRRLAFTISVLWPLLAAVVAGYGLYVIMDSVATPRWLSTAVPLGVAAIFALVVQPLWLHWYDCQHLGDAVLDWLRLDRRLLH